MRSIDQILSDERIELSTQLIRTPEATVRPGESWILHQYHWAPLQVGYYSNVPNAFAVAVLVAAVGLLSRPIPAGMPWLIPLAFGCAIGATWSIGRSLLSRWLEPSTPERPTRGITFAAAGSEGAITLFQSDDEQEIKIMRQKLEQTLLPSAT